MLHGMGPKKIKEARANSDRRSAVAGQNELPKWSGEKNDFKKSHPRRQIVGIRKSNDEGIRGSKCCTRMAGLRLA